MHFAHDTMRSFTLVCGTCGSASPADADSSSCTQCGDVLEVRYERDFAVGPQTRERFRSRLSSFDVRDRSGVWRFRELLPEFAQTDIVSLGEGNAPEFGSPFASAWSGVPNLRVKHLGYNPTGSYKDAGMTAAVSRANAVRAPILACASTGNTSASLAVYAARAGMRAAVLLPADFVTTSKLSQAIDAGAAVITIDGDFDVAMTAVRRLADRKLVYLVNSLNPFRREGQKTVAFEILEQRGWAAPDWVVLPGGNLGHCVSLGKGFQEAFTLGFVDRLPKIAVVQAGGAAPFVTAWLRREPLRAVRAQTFASAINIGNPVSWRSAIRVLDALRGTAVAVSDARIAEARAVLARDGLGCEPASAASLAGICELRARGDIAPDDDVVALLTGDSLKDVEHVIEYHRDGVRPSANRLCKADATVAALELAIEEAFQR
ncbi:MAG: threonine synthase [Vulcanimicrobiaceae bacterium]